MLVLPDAWGIALAERVAVGAVIAAAIALFGYRARWLSASGAIAAGIVGAFAFGFGGLLVASAIVIFFVAGSALSSIRSETAEAVRRRAAKGARRDWAQVVANGGVATACALLGALAASQHWPSERRWVIAAVCAVAAVSGDTWSTEVGALFRGSVLLITSMRRVVPGTSGGISALGTIAAPLGGAVVGLAGITDPALGIGGWLALGASAGLAGSIFDSVLGATAQGMWICAGCGQPTESRSHPQCQAHATLLRGFAWLDNDGVNALASGCGALLGFVLGNAGA